MSKEQNNLPENPSIPDENIPTSAENTAEEINQTEQEQSADISDDAVAEVPAVEKISSIKKIKSSVSVFFKKCGLSDMLLLRFLGVYLLVSGINFGIARKDNLKAIANWQEYVESANTLATILYVLGGIVVLTILYRFLPKRFHVLDQTVLIAGVLTFSLNVVWRNNDFYLAMGISAVAVVFIQYAVGKLNRRSLDKVPTVVSGIIVGILAIGVTAFVAVTTVAHNGVFSTSCYDFGIFVQMFHSMITDFTAVTTCERDTLLSHFYVHASFIYYLLAPVYALFPHPNTLLIAQAILAMGGIVPLFLIAKNHKYKGIPLIAVCMMYIFCAGIIAPCYYDFHENAFLPTLLMWTLYAMDKKKYILFYIMSILVCIVKEDAPLYIMCIALFLLFNEKSIKRLHGLIVTIISAIYFVFITNYLTKNGDGSMMAATRFGNLTINADDGFAGIIKNVLVDPAYFFSLFLKEESIPFFLEIFVPLLFMPFITKKISRFLLMIPFVIMNLVVGSGYGYAASVGYQYIFGPVCLLIYMAIINYDDIKPEYRTRLTISSAVISVITAVCLTSGNISNYESYTKNKSHYIQLEECLASVPEDASVVVNTWYLPHIANRNEVYIFDNNDFDIDPDDDTIRTLKDPDRYDFFVMSYGDDATGYAIPQLEALGYTKYNEVENYMVIYKSPTYNLSE
jgi:uncharacterized membrane protein